MSNREIGPDMEHSGSDRRLTIREEQKHLTRERLLDAAVAVFEEVGFRPATLDQIATKAGANRTTLYLHFKDKIDLAAAVSERLVTIGNELYVRLGSMKNPTLQDFRDWLDQLHSFRAAYPVLFEVAHEAATSDSAVSARHLRFHKKKILELMAPLLLRYPPEERESVCGKIMLLNLMTDRYFFITQIQGTELPITKWLDDVASLWWDGLLRDAFQKNAE
jgi:AcrR family transcriptional regulator